MIRLCPTHKTQLLAHRTKYGLRWACHEPGCTVVCWGNETSTPADAETRKLRHKCHAAFDPLWRQRKRFKDRKGAYRWLQRTLDLPRDQVHIGMLEKLMCRELLAILKNPAPLLTRPNDPLY